MLSEVESLRKAAFGCTNQANAWSGSPAVHAPTVNRNLSRPDPVRMSLGYLTLLSQDLALRLWAKHTQEFRRQQFS